MSATIPTASEFLQKFNSLFPPSLLGTNDSITNDEDLNACKMFDPVEFYGNKNNNNRNYTNNEFSRQTSDQTVRTERDAWYSSGGAPMDDYTERTEEVPTTLREEDDAMELIYDHTHLPLANATTASYYTTRDGRKKIHRRTARNQHKTKQQHQHYKTNRNIVTTIWLLVLCIVLTMVLGILILVLHPFQGAKTDNIITNSSNGNGNGNNKDQTISVVPPSITDTTNSTDSSSVMLIPTMAPVTTTTRTDAPIRSPSTNPRPVPITPIMEPTMVANPTAIPPVPSDNNNRPDKKPPQTPTVPPLSMGPIVGHTTHNSVTLWAYHDHNDATAEIVLYDSDTDVMLRSIKNLVQRKDKNNAFLETVGGLQPSTSYKFGMHIRGERVGKGSFTTAPAPPLGLVTSKSRNIANNATTTTTTTNGVQFDYILASCMNYRQYKDQIVWDAIYDALGGRYPDFSILAGDTVYLQEGVDVTTEQGVDFDRLWFRNQEQRTEEHFAEFIAHTPTYATWNDHEYGKNNANKDQKGKANSLYAWESLWANPGYGDATTDDGVYYSYYWGDVHFLVTDDHWYRDPSNDNRLGTKQTEWLKQELIDSKGTFKVIVIGSDIMERGWSSDLTNIGDIVRDHSIDGVLFHAGDIHRNEYKTRITGGFPYPVHQITSSGIAKVWRRPFVHIQVDTAVSDPSLTAFFYGAVSTAQTTTWKNDPNLVCSSIVGTDRDKEHSCTETIKLSNLRASPR